VILTASLRKVSLTAHVASSVGWMGAVAAFLALALAGLWYQDAETPRAAYISMRLVTWWVIVPLSVASLVTGLVQSLGTPWGLLRHYWVVTKLVIAVVASVLLLLHTQPIEAVARAAEDGGFAGEAIRRLRLQLVVDAIAALVALAVTTALSVFKPVGVLRSSANEIAPQVEHANARWRYAWLVGGVCVIALFLLKHLAGGHGGHVP
jgi:hypothetical protein